MVEAPITIGIESFARVAALPAVSPSAAMDTSPTAIATTTAVPIAAMMRILIPRSANQASGDRRLDTGIARLLGGGQRVVALPP